MIHDNTLNYTAWQKAEKPSLNKFPHTDDVHSYVTFSSDSFPWLCYLTILFMMILGNTLNDDTWWYLTMLNDKKWVTLISGQVLSAAPTCTKSNIFNCWYLCIQCQETLAELQKGWSYFGITNSTLVMLATFCISGNDSGLTEGICKKNRIFCPIEYDSFILKTHFT